jgi:hypothetical protein
VDELDDLETARYLEATQRKKGELQGESIESKLKVSNIAKLKRQEAVDARKEKRKSIKAAKAKKAAEKLKALESSSSDETSDDDDSDSDDTSSEGSSDEEGIVADEASSAISEFIKRNARLKHRKTLKEMREARREFVEIKVFKMPFGCCAGSEVQAVNDKNFLGSVKLELNR